MSVHLLDAELRRFFSRRVVRGAVLCAFLIVVIVNVVQFARSNESASRSRGKGADLPAACRVRTENGVAVYSRRCLEQGISGYLYDERYGPDVQGPGSLPPGLNIEPIIIEQQRDRRIDVARTFADTIRGIGAGFVFLSIGLASSFLAADYGASIGTQLMFEPRRRLVYVTKTLAVMIGTAAVVGAVVVVAGLLQLLGSATRGITTGLDAAWFGHRAVDVARVMFACALAAPLGLALAALTKRTVAAVGVFFGMFIALNFLGRSSWGKPIAKLLPINSLVAIAIDQFKNADDFFGLRTLGGAVTIAVVYAIGLTLLTSLWFERSEIR